MLFIHILSLIFLLSPLTTFAQVCSSSIPTVTTLNVNGVKKTVISLPVRLGESGCFIASGIPNTPARKVVFTTTLGSAAVRHDDAGKALFGYTLYRKCASTCQNQEYASNLLTNDLEHCGGRSITYYKPVTGGECGGTFGVGKSIYYAGTVVCVKDASAVNLQVVTSVSPVTSILEYGNCKVTASPSVSPARCGNYSIDATIIGTSIITDSIRGRMKATIGATRGYLPDSYKRGCNDRIDGLWLKDDSNGFTGYNYCLSRVANYAMTYDCRDENLPNGFKYPEFSTSVIQKDAGLGFDIDYGTDFFDVISKIVNIPGTILVTIIIDEPDLNVDISLSMCKIVTATGNVRSADSNVKVIAVIENKNARSCWIRAPNDEVTNSKCVDGYCTGLFTAQVLEGSNYCSINCVQVNVSISMWNNTYSSWCVANTSYTYVDGKGSSFTSADVSKAFFGFGNFLSGTAFSNPLNGFVSIIGFLFSVALWGGLVYIAFKILMCVRKNGCKKTAEDIAEDTIKQIRRATIALTTKATSNTGNSDEIKMNPLNTA